MVTVIFLVIYEVDADNGGGCGGNGSESFNNDVDD